LIEGDEALGCGIKATTQGHFEKRKF